MNIKHIIGVAIIASIFCVLNGYTYQEIQRFAAKDHKNAEYVIDGRRVKLEEGISEVISGPGSTSKIVTRYFGNEVYKDLNDDGREDIVFLLTQETGGSGTFFYVAAAINTEAGYIGSQGLFLGDRIAPQNTESGPGKIIIINYADRAHGEPLTMQPSIGKSIHLLLDPETMQFGEVVHDFEGEADPARMTLTMKTWNWISLHYKDGRQVTPKQPNLFTLTFSKNSIFSATTDCNSMTGHYEATNDTISFGPVASTKMFCADSQEMEFAAVLENATGYRFTSKGELVLQTKIGSAVFR
jgi:heat shock protein HslJ